MVGEATDGDSVGAGRAAVFFDPGPGGLEPVHGEGCACHYRDFLIVCQSGSFRFQNAPAHRSTRWRPGPQ